MSGWMELIKSFVCGTVKINIYVKDFGYSKGLEEIRHESQIWYGSATVYIETKAI